jgi:hypothetical protein
MNKTEWFQKASQNKTALLDLIARYHPSMALRGDGFPAITAPVAEQVCEVVRKQVKAKYSDEYGIDKKLATTLFSESLDNNDYVLAYQILSETWFGVPETQDCWGFLGFSEAVELLDDPVEERELLNQ